MALEQEDQQKEVLEKMLKSVNAYDVANLVRKDLGPTLNFEKYTRSITRTLSLFKALSECNLDTVPANILRELASQTNQALSHLQSIHEFSLEKHPNNPIDTRNSIGDQLENTYSTQYNIVAPVIAYAVRKGTDFARLESQARETVERLDVTLKENQEAIKNKLADVESTVEKVRQAAQEVGIAQHNLLFNDEAKGFQKSATTWLRITGVLAAITLIAAFGVLFIYLWGSSDVVAKLQSPNLIAIKIIIFGVLISSTLWAGRVYRSNQHNYVVNKHRANALSTFETFVKGAGEDHQTKSAVLLQATQCIFSSQPSGYIAQESEGGMYKQILEIVRGDSGQRH